MAAAVEGVVEAVEAVALEVAEQGVAEQGVVVLEQGRVQPAGAAVTEAVMAARGMASVLPATVVQVRAATRSALAAAPHCRHREATIAPAKRPRVSPSPCPARPIRPAE